MTTITNMSKINEEKRVEDEDPINEYIETPWTIIGSYFKDQHLKQLVRHQIESYNLFINLKILLKMKFCQYVQIIKNC